MTQPCNTKSRVGRLGPGVDWVHGRQSLAGDSSLAAAKKLRQRQLCCWITQSRQYRVNISKAIRAPKGGRLHALEPQTVRPLSERIHGYFTNIDLWAKFRPANGSPPLIFAHPLLPNSRRRSTDPVSTRRNHNACHPVYMLESPGEASKHG